jgi:hypothetical protein
MENEKTFREFLEWESENALNYYAEELRREHRQPVALPLSADYWAGYSDAVSNALAAYAGPTDIKETMKGN